MSKRIAHRDPIKQFLALVRAAVRFKRSRAEVVRLIESHPKRYIPLTIATAQESSPEGERAALALETVLKRTADINLLLFARECLPDRSLNLAKCGEIVYSRLISSFDTGELTGLELKATFLNNFSEWLDANGETEGALENAKQSTVIFASVSKRNSAFKRELTSSLMTLSKRFSALGKHREAIEAAEAAVWQAQELITDGTVGSQVLLAKAKICFATRCYGGTDRDRALKSVEEACEILENLEQNSNIGSVDLAYGYLIRANILTENGEHRLSLPLAEKAYDRAGSLAANDGDVHTDFFLATANTYSINLAHHDETSKGRMILAQCVEHLKVMAQRFPKRFLREYATYLISYSATCGEGGRFAEATKMAELAVKESKRLRALFKNPDLMLEGRALNNLYNREYESCDFKKALSHAKAAEKFWRRNPKNVPTRTLNVAQALRNLAEAQRVCATSPRKRRIAIETARKAVRVIKSAKRSPSEASNEVAAYCHTTLALCLADGGKLREAIMAEFGALRHREALFRDSPLVYRRGLAFSLCSLATYELEDGRLDEAWEHIQIAESHYSELRKEGVAPIWTFYLRAIRTKSRILAALDNVAEAMGLLEATVADLEPHLRGIDKMSDIERTNVLHLFNALAPRLGRKEKVSLFD